MNRRWMLMLIAVMTTAVVVAGCGSDPKDDAKETAKKAAALKGVKGDAVQKSQTAFDKNPKDISACRQVAQSWIAYASPDAPKKQGDTVKIPKDRNDSLKVASVTLEKCRSLKGADESIDQMLASTYMGMSRFDKAAPILKSIAESRKTDANSYYAWGLAESSAGNTAVTIAAWKMFLKYADKKDPRIAQVKDSIKALEAAPPAPAEPKADDSDK